MEVAEMLSALRSTLEDPSGAELPGPSRVAEEETGRRSGSHHGHDIQDHNTCARAITVPWSIPPSGVARESLGPQALPFAVLFNTANTAEVLCTPSAVHTHTGLYTTDAGWNSFYRGRPAPAGTLCGH